MVLPSHVPLSWSKSNIYQCCHCLIRRKVTFSRSQLQLLRSWLDPLILFISTTTQTPTTPTNARKCPKRCYATNWQTLHTQNARKQRVVNTPMGGCFITVPSAQIAVGFFEPEHCVQTKAGSKLFHENYNISEVQSKRRNSADQYIYYLKTLD